MVSAEVYASGRQHQRGEYLKAHNQQTNNIPALRDTRTRCNIILTVCFPVSVPTSLWQIAFFNQHGCTTNAANAKYNSRAAQLYREKIKTLATQATRRHGTEVMQTS